MENSLKSLDVFEFKEEEDFPTMTRICSKSLGSDTINRHTVVENGKCLFECKEDDDFPIMTRVSTKPFASEALNKHRVVENEYYNLELKPLLDEGQQCNSTGQELFHHVRHNVLSGTFYPQLEGSSSPLTASAEDDEHASRESQSNDGSVDAASDTIESASVNTPTSSASPANNDLYDNPSTENHHSHWEMGEKMPIVFHPDFICYRDAYYTDCVVNFSNSCIEVKGSSVSGNLETFSTHFAIDDINQIQLEYCMRADAGQFKIHAISRCSEQPETGHGTSEIEELQFYVHDSDLSEKCQAITSLDGYKALWDSNSEVGQRKGVQMGNFKLTKNYFPSCDESFEEVVYPKGDSDAVSISKRDFDLLQPDTFINDTIIDFYIMYLKKRIHPERRHKYHFFNSFFFRKLADMDKDPSNAFDGRAAFLRVRKWTRKVNLFEKDFVFIPVNYNLHWSLIVICHPGEVANMEADNLVKMSRVPCILHMDSMRGSHHTGLKDLFQSYLWEEWKERLKEFSEGVSPKFLNLRFASLELPQQQNFVDCGLFLLHYVECFLAEDPADVNPFNITKNSHFLSSEWFQPDEPSCKRSYIQRLIHDLLESHSCENSPSGESESCIPFNPLEGGGDHKPNAVEFTLDHIGGSKSYHMDLLSHQTSEGFEINGKDPHCASSSGESFVANSNLQAQIDMHFGCSLSFNEVKPTLPSIQEEAEPSGDFVYAAAASTETGFGHHLAAFAFPYNDLEVTVEREKRNLLDDHMDEPTVAENAISFIESLPSSSNTMLGGTSEPQCNIQNGSPAPSQNLCELLQVEFVDNTNNVDDDDRPAKKMRLMTPVEREVVELKSHSEDLHL